MNESFFLKKNSFYSKSALKAIDMQKLKTSLNFYDSSKGVHTRENNLDFKKQGFYKNIVP